MRSNSNNSATKQSTKRSKSRLPLALTAVVAVFTLGGAADAAQRMGGSGGACIPDAGCLPPVRRPPDFLNRPRDLEPPG